MSDTMTHQGGFPETFYILISYRDFLEIVSLRHYASLGFIKYEND